MPSPTDLRRWEATARETPVWQDRNRVIGSWIAPGSSVLDVGAGSMNLREFLPPGCRYQPADVVLPSDATRFVDFNAYTLPRFDDPFDVVVASGVLEYVVDPDFLLRTVAGWGRAVILSYAVATDPPDLDARRRAGWISHLSAAELRTALAAAGLRIVREDAWQSQRLFLLVSTGITATRDVAHLSKWPVSLFRADRTNVGDWFSAPVRHLRALDGPEVDIFRINAPTLIDAPTIIGGGGLFSPVFNTRFEQITFAPAHPVIGWGLGENMRIDTQGGWVDEGPFELPAWTGRCDLLGVRDYGSVAPWVPCVSCLHPSFLSPHVPVHEVVVFSHKRIPIDAPGLPGMTNEGHDLEAVLDFLGSGHVVVTNSYHGAYWATLLGRAVVALPFSSKFWGLRHRPVFARPAGWRRAIEFARPYPTALADCRRATQEFAAQAVAMLGGKSATPAASAVPARSTTIVAAGSVTRWSTPQDIESGLTVFGLGPVQRARIAAELRWRSPVWCLRHDDELPEAQARAVVIAPGVVPAAGSLCERLAASAVVIALGAEHPTLDTLKSRLHDRWQIGVEAPGRHEVWCGARERTRATVGTDPLPLVASCFTVDTPYQDEARGLAASCDRLGVTHDIRPIVSRGTWEANCALKATFLRDLWHERREPLLWVDADARLHRAPDLLRGVAADFAVHKVDGWQFASGTLFFNQTPLAGVLLDTWERLCRQQPHIFDQVLLDVAWEEVMRQFPLTTAWLPPGYTLIYDRPEALAGRDAPVIVHHQASRALKRVVSVEPPRPAPSIPAEWRQARRASRSWLDRWGWPEASRLILDPDYVPVPGTPDPVPAAFTEFEAALGGWMARHSAGAGKVAIFGASWFGARVCARFRLAGIEPVCFLDNDPARQTQEVLGLPVAPPVAELVSELDTIVIASIAHSHAIEATLRAVAGRRTLNIIAAHQSRLGDVTPHTKTA